MKRLKLTWGQLLVIFALALLLALWASPRIAGRAPYGVTDADFARAHATQTDPAVQGLARKMAAQDARFRAAHAKKHQ